MPAKSKAQQKAAGAALAAKRGETPVKELFGASRDMHDSMTEAELEEMAATPREDLPEKAEDGEKSGSKSESKPKTKSKSKSGDKG